MPRPHGREVQPRLLPRRRGRGRVLVGVVLLVLKRVGGVVLLRTVVVLILALAALPRGVLLPRGRDLERRRRRRCSCRRRRSGSGSLCRLVLFRPAPRRQLRRRPLVPLPSSVLAASSVPVSSSAAAAFAPALPGRARGQRRQRLGRRDVVDLVGEVAPRSRPADGARRGVVRPRGLLGRVVRAEPPWSFVSEEFGTVFFSRAKMFVS